MMRETIKIETNILDFYLHVLAASLCFGWKRRFKIQVHGTIYIISPLYHHFVNPLFTWYIFTPRLTGSSIITNPKYSFNYLQSY